MTMSAITEITKNIIQNPLIWILQGVTRNVEVSPELDFPTIFMKTSILHKIKSNTCKTEYKSFIYIISKSLNEKIPSWGLEDTP